jgi:DNA-binding NarL/FixJ family response regulator
MNQPGKPTANPPEPAPAGPSNPVRVILADGQAIYRVGIRKIFAVEDDIRVVAQAESVGQLLIAAARFPADVVLLESAICNNPAEVVSEILKRQAEAKVIILTAEPGEEDTVDYLRRGVRGIVQRTISPDLLVKCVRRVAGGETWLDNRGVNWLIDAYRSQARQLVSPPPKARLSEKELRIIAGVTKGMRNKEIASEIGTTEQVVKNYLRKVYDKLGVSDRLELALYCVHHELLKGVRVKGPIDGVTPDAPEGPKEPNGGAAAGPTAR